MKKDWLTGVHDSAKYCVSFLSLMQIRQCCKAHIQECTHIHTNTNKLTQTQSNILFFISTFQSLTISHHAKWQSHLSHYSNIKDARNQAKALSPWWLFLSPVTTTLALFTTQQPENIFCIASFQMKFSTSKSMMLVMEKLWWKNVTRHTRSNSNHKPSNAV